MYPLIFQKQFALAENFKRPQRIVSLVPSQTETLASLGLDERVAGITKYCVHPALWQQQKTIVGGTKKVDLELIKSLQPDLILANKEENIKEQAEALAEICPVYVSDVVDYGTALEMILQIGLLVGAKLQAELLIHEIVLAFDALEKAIATSADSNKKFAYLIWRKPYMAAGGDTFINNMLQKCGLQNAFATQPRYPTVTVEELQQAAPDVLLLSSEPYPFGQKHIDELKMYLPNTNIQLVDGEMFSWHGSRLLKAAGYFSTIIPQLLL